MLAVAQIVVSHRVLVDEVWIATISSSVEANTSIPFESVERTTNVHMQALGRPHLRIVLSLKLLMCSQLGSLGMINMRSN